MKRWGNLSFRYLKGPFIIFQWKVYERGTICQWKVYERGTFLPKMVYKRIRGRTSGRRLSLPSITGFLR